MERLYSQGRVEVRSLSLDKDFLPGRFKVCAEVEMPGQEATKDLTDSDRIELGRKIAQRIAGICPGQGSIFITIDAAREKFVNIGIYTNSRSDIHALRDAKGVFPQFAFDISDPDNPKQLVEKEWLKK